MTTLLVFGRRFIPDLVLVAVLMTVTVTDCDDQRKCIHYFSKNDLLRAVSISGGDVK